MKPLIKIPHSYHLILGVLACWGCGTQQTSPAVVSTLLPYQGMVNIQAYGEATAAPAGTPAARQVTLSWAAFREATSATEYVLVRVATGGTLDTTITTDCTDLLSTSCRVCTVIGTGTQTCSDLLVAASPAAYDYAVVRVIGGTPESIPTVTGTYKVTVQIPPANMVLVHRDAVNWQTCTSMGLATDAVNHNRCDFTGYGATPYNSGPGKAALNLDSSYFDFGYNLFVDRWEAGCKWTAGTSCSGGDCFGTATLNSGIGAANDVYYNTSMGNCFVKTDATTWVDLNTGSLTSGQRALALTNIPSTTSRVPPLVEVDQAQAWNICQAVTDATYGTKRLLRRREFIAAAAWPYFTGDPDLLSDAQINALEAGSDHPGTFVCNSNTHNGVTAAAFNSASYELSRGVAAGPESFVLGSTGTSACLSRSGAQDFVGNVWEWTSDQLGTFSTGAGTVSGVASSLDSGNTDWSVLLFDGTLNPGGTGEVMIGPLYNYFSFLVPWGLPAVFSPPSAAGAYAVGLGATNFSANYLHSNQFDLSATSGTTRAALSGGSATSGITNGTSSQAAGVFTVDLNHDQTGSISSAIGFRCALSAE